MHSQKVLDRTGHTTVEFDPKDKLSTEQAMGRFNLLVREQQFVAFEPGPDGKPGRLLRDFDPNAKETIFHQQLVGG